MPAGEQQTQANVEANPEKHLIAARNVACHHARRSFSGALDRQAPAAH
jgi:hypothetical protein